VSFSGDGFGRIDASTVLGSVLGRGAASRLSDDACAGPTASANAAQAMYLLYGIAFEAHQQNSTSGRSASNAASVSYFRIRHRLASGSEYCSVRQRAISCR